MGFLMFAGLMGMLGYMGHYAKKETTAIIGDAKIKPVNTVYGDKKIIEDNFKLICKRGNAKLDINGNPVYKNHYKPCIAYLQYQGFQEPAVRHFEKIYLEKYNRKNKNKKKEIEDKHWHLEMLFYDKYDERETKIFRYWHYGDTQAKCNKLMNNWFWSTIVDYYNIVKDGNKNVEVWSITAPPQIIRQLNTIYDEVCFLEIMQ